MRVILLQDIRKVGKKHEIKDVSDGYAKNFLIVKGLAEAATPERIKYLELLIKNEEEEQKKRKSLTEALARELELTPLEFKMRTGKKGELYASIGSKEIEAEFKKRGIDVKINLEKPLKALGKYQLEIDLGLDEKKRIVVSIVAEERK